MQTKFLHYLVTFIPSISWIERDKYMNKNMSITTRHHSFWWLIIKSAGEFHNLVPKKSNNIFQILWLIIKTPQLLTAGNKNQQESVTDLHPPQKKKSNNISKVLWLVILTLWKPLQLLTSFFFNLRENKMDNLQKNAFLIFDLTTFSPILLGWIYPTWRIINTVILIFMTLRAHHSCINNTVS